MLTRILLGLCVFGMLAEVHAGPRWEEVASFHCRDGKDGYSKRQVDVGYDVRAIRIENQRSNRGTTVAAISFNRGPVRAERRARRNLEGSYYGQARKVVRFNRVQDLDTMFLRCTSHRSSKRSYLKVYVERRQRGDRRRGRRYNY